MLCNPIVQHVGGIGQTFIFVHVCTYRGHCGPASPLPPAKITEINFANVGREGHSLSQPCNHNHPCGPHASTGNGQLWHPAPASSPTLMLLFGRQTPCPSGSFQHPSPPPLPCKISPSLQTRFVLMQRLKRPTVSEHWGMPGLSAINYSLSDRKYRGSDWHAAPSGYCRLNKKKDNDSNK